jgi:GAF domain-containing protein
MVAQGNTIGVLQLQFEMTKVLRGKSDKEIRDSRERLAVSAASHIALSLASLQLRETLREQSIRDPLTRLFNRRFLEESMARDIASFIKPYVVDNGRGSGSETTTPATPVG